MLVSKCYGQEIHQPNLNQAAVNDYRPPPKFIYEQENGQPSTEYHYPIPKSHGIPKTFPHKGIINLRRVKFREAQPRKSGPDLESYHSYQRPELSLIT